MSKNKNLDRGKHYERKLCEKLNRDFPEFEAKRTIGSGAHGNNHSDQRGDIQWSKFPHVNLEVKSSQNFSLDTVISGKCALLDGWIRQASKDNDQFLLFIKIPYIEWSVVRPWKCVNKAVDAKCFLYYNGYIISTYQEWCKEYN